MPDIDYQTRTVIKHLLSDFEEKRQRDVRYRIASELLTREVKPCNDLVSIVVTVYGVIDPLRLECSLLSMKSQSEINLEIILAEQTFAENRYELLARRMGIKYVSDRVQSVFGSEHFNSGRIRNVGIAASRGDIVYLTDSDILFTDTMYLARISQILNDYSETVLIWPKMRHIITKGQQEFCQEFLQNQKWDPTIFRRLNDWAWQFAPKRLAPEMQSPELKEMAIDGKRYLAYEDDIKMYMAQRDLLRGWESRLLLACRHDGAIAARRSQLDIVGGYGECFYQWGYEDYDLQWKLREVFCVVELEDFPEFEVVHLDHERTWFDKFLFERNALIHRERREKGVISAICMDVLENNSNYGQELRARWHIVLDPIKR